MNDEELGKICENSNTEAEFKRKVYDKYGIGNWWDDFKLAVFYNNRNNNTEKLNKLKNIVTEAVKETNKVK